MTAPGRPDPLTAPLALVASELLGTVLDPAHDHRQDAPMARRLPTADPAFDDEPLDDEPFRAVIERSSYRPPTESEADVVAECLDWLSVQPHCEARKVHGGPLATSAEPDLDIVWHGRAAKIEAKARGKGVKYRPTRAQDKRLHEYQDAGALVGYVQSLADLKEIMARADDPAYRYTGQRGAPGPAPTTEEP